MLQVITKQTQTTATNNYKLYNKQQKCKNYRKTILTVYEYDCLFKSHKYMTNTLPLSTVCTMTADEFTINDLLVYVQTSLIALLKCRVSQAMTWMSWCG